MEKLHSSPWNFKKFQFSSKFWENFIYALKLDLGSARVVCLQDGHFHYRIMSDDDRLRIFQLIVFAQFCFQNFIVVIGVSPLKLGLGRVSQRWAILDTYQFCRTSSKLGEIYQFYFRFLNR